jgi:5-methylcytosine-specific restriction endonuclease McrA
MTAKERSIEALVGYGIDTDKAKELVTGGNTITVLKGLNAKQMAILGIHSVAVSNIRETGRPPIPGETIRRLLLKTQRTCSVCYQVGRSVAIHHINAWSKAKNHDEKNLIVLCLNCHGEAHTTRELGKNLTPELLRDHKKNWEDRVERAASRAVLGLSTVGGGNWDYLNQVRLLKLTDSLKVSVEALPLYAELRASQKINKDGSLAASESDKKNKMYVYEGEAIVDLYWYVKGLIAALLPKLSVTDVSNALDKVSLRALAHPGDFIFFQGACYFKPRTKIKRGPGQWRTFLRQIGNVRIEGGFDAWEATSTSCWSDRLCGRKVSNILGVVESTEERDGVLTVRISCLAIGSYFRTVYSPPLHPVSDPEEEFEDEHSEELASRK